MNKKISITFPIGEMLMVNDDVFNPASKRKKLETDLVPLINIVFLLLIFFLVTGNALSPADKSFEDPDAITSRYIEDDALNIRLTKDHMICIDEKILAKDEINNLSGFFSALFKKDADRQVLISADSRLLSSYLISMLNIISDAGAVNIAIATRGDGYVK